MPRARTLEERIEEIRPDRRQGERKSPLRFVWLVAPVAAIATLLALRACLHTEPLDRLAPVHDEPILAIADAGVPVADANVVAVADAARSPVADANVVAIADAARRPVADANVVAIADAARIPVADAAGFAISDAGRMPVADAGVVAIADARAVVGDAGVAIVGDARSAASLDAAGGAEAPVVADAGVVAERGQAPAVHASRALGFTRAGFLAIARGGPVVIGLQTDSRPARVRVVGLVAVPPPLDMLRVGMPLEEARRHPGLGNARPVTASEIAVEVGQGVTAILDHDGKAITGLGVELHGSGLIKARVLALHGALPIQVEGDPRLMWNPVGRRGDPEYIPASSLSPDGAFDNPGTSPLDGAIALAILGVIIATACGLARKRLAAVSRDTWLAMAGVLVVALVVRLVGLSDHGQTWDEDVNWGAGRNYVTNVLGLDFAERSWVWNYEHPPIMKLLDGIGAQLADGFGVARALSALWVSLGCALLVPIGARLYKLRAGLLAGAIAALLPPLVAHGQIVGHESPTVLWWSLGIMLALGAHDYLPIDDRRALALLRRRLVWLGFVVGLAIASRFVNGLLGPLCALIVVLQAPPRWRRATIGWGAALMPLAAIATVYLVWPRLWAHPLAHLGAAFDKLSGLHDEEPFFGTLTSSPGPHYFIVYLVLTTPVGVLAGVLAWKIRCVFERKTWRPAVITGAWLAIPLLGVMLSPVRQDGVRYILPCLLAIAVMAAAGIDWLATKIPWRHAFWPLAGALVAYLGVVDVRTRPYYLDYFNEFSSAGELAAHKTVETAWWGEGLDRAIDYVNDHARPGDRVLSPAACIAPYHMAWFREDLWPQMTPNPGQATWIVAYAPATKRCPLPADARDVFEVRHDGVVLAAVYRR